MATGTDIVAPSGNHGRPRLTFPIPRMAGVGGRSVENLAPGRCCTSPSRRYAPCRCASASVMPESSRAYIRRDSDPVMLRWHCAPLRVIADDSWRLRAYQAIRCHWIWPVGGISIPELTVPGPQSRNMRCCGRPRRPPGVYQPITTYGQATLIVERFGLKFHRAGDA